MASINEKTSLVPRKQNTGATRSLAAARSAYSSVDVEASRIAHGGAEIPVGNAESHDSGGAFVKPIVFGGLDGVLTCFAIVMGAVGGGLSRETILIIGFSSLLADAVSMGVGEFLSTKAEQDYSKMERQRESWELRNYPEGEVKEMREIYEEKGMSAEDAGAIFKIMAKPEYHDIFVDFMMREELGLEPPSDDDTAEALKSGVVMFFAFCFFGSLPLLCFVAIPAKSLTQGQLTACAVTVTLITLFVLGSFKARFSTRSWIMLGLESTMLGGACAFLAWSVGKLAGGGL
mmetsp:Transcript_30951/g.60397  ORF Transcript_30951/g.60397 Transcript_30951/m.60397 type:complete len:289 (+) Transcript_30951:22-888(+)